MAWRGMRRRCVPHRCRHVDGARRRVAWGFPRREVRHVRFPELQAVHGSCWRLGIGRFAAASGHRRRDKIDRRHAPAGAAEQGGRLRLRQLFMGQAGQRAHLRVLRERRQGDLLGTRPGPGRCGVLHPSYRVRTADLGRPRPGDAGPHRRADALRRRQRPLRGGVLGRGVRADRQRDARARSRQRRVLRLRPGVARDLVHVCAAGTHVRQQQPARQLQHVSRKHVGRAAAQHRRAGRHGPARGLRALRLHPVVRPERRRQQSAHAAPAAGSEPPRRDDPDLQPAVRTRLGALHQSAGTGGDGDRPVDPDQRRVLPGPRRQRSVCDPRHRQGAAGARRPRPYLGPGARAGRRFHRDAHPRIRRLRRVPACQ